MALDKIRTELIADDAVTAAKIPAGAVGTTEIAEGALSVHALQNTTSHTLSGTYTDSKMYTSDAYVLGGDITVNSNLVLSTVKGDGSDITLTDDGTTRTITGTGKLEVGAILGVKNDLTGMTGAISSAVTGTLGTGITFPAGSIIQVVNFVTSDRGSVATNSGGGDTDLNPSIEKAITPKGNGSSFLIKIRWLGEAQDFHGIRANIHKNGVRVNATNTSTTPDFDFHLAGLVQSYHGSDYDSTNEYLNFETLDTTGSTAGEPITFKLVMCSGSSKTIFTNRCEDRDSYGGGTSEIIVMEIAG